MPLPADDGVIRRDETLARTRRASRLITTAAVTAAVVLGTAFAHALPGHHAAAQAAPAGASATSVGSAAQGPGRRAAPARRHAHHYKARLQPPSQPPATAPAPPQAASGGS